MNLQIHKLKSTLIFFLCLSFSFSLFAQPGKDEINIKLKNGSAMFIRICNDNIFRIRIASKNEFPESLMDRYSITKNDWKPMQPQVRTEKENQVIQTAGYQIVVNTKTGEMNVKDAKGKTIIDRIAFNDVNAPISAELGGSLNSYFGKAKTGAGIIGDSTHIGEKKEATEVGDFKQNSVLDISLKGDDRLYGGGSTSRQNIQHRGTALRMWATYKKTEIPMPFLMSSNGWGIFNATTVKNFFDIGRYQKDKLYIYNTTNSADFYLMMGNSMVDVIDAYTLVTGRPYVLPKWAYGLAFGPNTKEDQFDFMNDAIRFRTENIPCDIFWIEPQWMAKFYDFSTTKSWNYEKFPGEPFWDDKNPNKYEAKTLFIAKLHDNGYKLALWMCIEHDMSIAEEDRLALKTGKPQSGQEHWFQHLTKFMDQGVDGFKLDPGRTLDEHPDRKYYNGYTDKEMHNMNQVLLPKQMYETFREHKGIRSFHHYCGGYAGAQHWSASTSGDNGGSRVAMFDQLNLGLSGYVNTSADVLEEVTDNKAGIHLGFFLPWVQVNSWYDLLHPWYMSPSEKETFKYYSQLRNTLNPYIYSAALQGSQTGMPIVRALPLIFPDDRNVDNNTYQFMFGDNLMVSVFSDSIYLPKGTWTNYWTGEKIAGGKTLHGKIPENRGGFLFVKAGAIIPFQKQMLYIGQRPTDTLVLKVYPDKKSSYTLLEDDGRTFDYETGNIAKTRFECNQANDKIEFTIHPCEGTYTGIFSSRTYELEIESAKKPAQVMLNGIKVENWKVTEGKVMLTVNQKNVREKLVVTIL